MIIKIEDTPKKVVFKKTDKSEPWFNNDCSNENLLKQSERKDGKIEKIRFEDGDYIASLLNVYFL